MQTEASKKRARSSDSGARGNAPAVNQIIPAPAGERTWSNAPQDVSISPGTTKWGFLTDSLMFRDAGTASQLKSLPSTVKLRVASFDMDDCLIYPKSGNVFPKNAEDWQWLITTPPMGARKGCDTVSTLRAVAKSYHIVVIYSNQEKVGKDPQYGKQIKSKIDAIAGALEIPLFALCATKKDGCRKPAACGWAAFCDWLHAATGGKSIDMHLSFYCGDAAGRTINTLAGRAKDFSCSDRKYAYNAKLQFYTPEEFFLGREPAPFSWREGMTPEMVEELKTAALAERPAALTDGSLTPGGKDIILMVGPPGSGKTSFYHTYLKHKGYEWINQDALATKAKVQSAVTVALAAGKPCCVDKTNPSSDDRRWFIAAAKKAGATIRCVFFATKPALVTHMNGLRACLPEELTYSGRVPDIAVRVFFAKFEMPTASEGFDQVIGMPLIPTFTADPRHEERFYWLS